MMRDCPLTCMICGKLDVWLSFLLYYTIWRMHINTLVG